MWVVCILGNTHTPTLGFGRSHVFLIKPSVGTEQDTLLIREHVLLWDTQTQQKHFQCSDRQLGVDLLRENSLHCPFRNKVPWVCYWIEGTKACCWHSTTSFNSLQFTEVILKHVHVLHTRDEGLCLDHIWVGSQILWERWAPSYSYRNIWSSMSSLYLWDYTSCL